MILRDLRVEDEAEAVRAQRLLAEDDFPFLFDFSERDDFAAYVRRVDDFNAGGRFSKGGVPGCFLVAEDQGRIVGRLSVRFELNDALRRFGGHVGYCVLPEFRRQGYATRLLEAGLDRLRSIGVDSALVTCDEDNEGSRRVIERVGGRFLGIQPGEAATPKRHYAFRLRD